MTIGTRKPVGVRRSGGRRERGESRSLGPKPALVMKAQKPQGCSRFISNLGCEDAALKAAALR
jgi:hypothetical protein